MAIDKELRLKITQQKTGTAIADLKADVEVLEKALLKVRVANVQLKKDYGAASQEFANGKKLELRTIAELTAQKKLLSQTEKLYVSEVKKANQEIILERKRSAEEEKKIAKEQTETKKKSLAELRREQQQSKGLTGQSVQLGSLSALKQQIAYFKQQRDAVAANTPAFAQLDQKVKSLTQSLKDQTSTGKRSTAQLLEMGENITVVSAGVLYLIQQVIQLGKQVFDAAQQGAEFEVLYKNFEKVNGGVENARKNLDLFRKASTGNLSDQELVKYSNSMTSLGYSAKTSAQLLDIAEKQGDKVGVVFETANSSLQKFITTGAARGLIDLGINVGTVHSAMEKVSGKSLEAIGKLSDLEQQTIRTDAVTSLYGDTLDNIGQKEGDHADKITELSKKYENLTTLLKVGVANAFYELTRGIGSTTSSFEENMKSAKSWGDSIGFAIRAALTYIIQGKKELNKLQHEQDQKNQDQYLLEEFQKSPGYELDQSNSYTYPLEPEDMRQARLQRQAIQDRINDVKASKGPKGSKTKDKDPYEQENKEAKEYLENINNELRLLELKKSKYKDLNEILFELAGNENLFTKEGIEADNYISFLELQKKLIGDIASQKITELDKQELITAELRKQLEINKDLPGAVANLNKQLEESLNIEKRLRAVPSLLDGKTPFSLQNLSGEVRGGKSQDTANLERYKEAYKKSQDTLGNVSTLLTMFDLRTDSALVKIVGGLEKGANFIDAVINLLGTKAGSGFLNILGTLLGFIPGVGKIASGAFQAGMSGGLPGLNSGFGNSNTGKIINNISSIPAQQNIIIREVPFIMKVKGSGTDLYYTLEKVRNIEQGRTG